MPPNDVMVSAVAYFFLRIWSLKSFPKLKDRVSSHESVFQVILYFSTFNQT